MTLKPQHERFRDAYFILPNATQAAITAGYSRKTAYSQGQRLLNNVEIKASLAELGSKMAIKTDITQQRVILEYARIALANMTDFMTWDQDGMKLKDSLSLTEEEVAAVAEVSQTITEHGGTLRLKLHDKKGALDSLAARLWPVIERSEHLNVNIDAGIAGMVEVIKRLKMTSEQLDTWALMLEEGKESRPDAL